MTKIINHIWVDADACPRVIKDHIFSFSGRLNLPVTLVANSQMQLPLSPLVKLIVVGKALDEADKYIIEHVKESELVITADIPLASEIVKKNAIALNPRGEIYDEDNIGEILSMRNFMKELRDGGAVTGGPSSINPKDVQSFTNSLNKLLSKRK